jgi:hypothetical protein
VKKNGATSGTDASPSGARTSDSCGI